MQHLEFLATMFGSDLSSSGLLSDMSDLSIGAFALHTIRLTRPAAE